MFPPIRDGFEAMVGDFGLEFRSLADIGCGTGIFLRYVLRYPLKLFGVDAARPMLRIAARRLAGAPVCLLCQDMRGLRLPRPVGLITCHGDTLNYLIHPHDLMRTLSRFRCNLRLGGHVIFDVLTGTPPPAPGPSAVGNANGGIIRWRCRVDPRRGFTRVEVNSLTSTGGGQWQREVHLQRWFRPREIQTCLRRCGLKLRAMRRLDQAATTGSSGAWLQLLAQAR